MKIKRFNENFAIFSEPWTKEKFKKINKIKSEIKQSDKQVCKLLTQYLLLNPQIQDNSSINLDPNEVNVLWYDFYDSESNYWVFAFGYSNSDFDVDESTVTLSIDQFDNLLEFLKDPDIYINAKTYNL
jgi:hypothetical protein